MRARRRTMRRLGAILLLFAAGAAQGRDAIRVVEAPEISGIFAEVEKYFWGDFRFPAPEAEGLHSDEAIQRFCAGVGPHEVDLILVARRVLAAEFDACADNGVDQIAEIELGFWTDGSYTPTAPVLVYVKMHHLGLIPSLKELVDEIVSERASGSEGYLFDAGVLDPAAEWQRDATREAWESGAVMERPAE